MPYKKYPLIRTTGIRTSSIHEQKFRLGIPEFGRPVYSGAGIRGFFESLPRTGAVQRFYSFADKVRAARKSGEPVILCLDDSAALSGIIPIVVDLMERGWVSALCVNWSFAVRDFEIAFAGRTDPEEWETGAFSLIEETGILLATALKDGSVQDVGCGEAIGLYLSQSQFPFSGFSLFYNAYKLNIPITVHPVCGGDACQFHPYFDSSAMALLAERDFSLLSSILARVQELGVWIHTAREQHLVKVLENALKFCSAQGISPPALAYGVLTSLPAIQLDWFAKKASGNGLDATWIPGDIELLFPLFSALLLNSPSDSNDQNSKGEK